MDIEFLCIWECPGDTITRRSVRWLRTAEAFTLTFQTYGSEADEVWAHELCFTDVVAIDYAVLGLSEPDAIGAFIQNWLYELPSSAWLAELRGRGCYPDPSQFQFKHFAIWLGGWLPLADDGLYQIAATSVTVSTQSLGKTPPHLPADSSA